MVDCDFFTEFNKQVIVESDRVLLDYKNCDYNLELNFPYRGCTKIAKNNSSNKILKSFAIKAVYGVVEMEVNSYLLVVTKASVIGQIFHRKIFQMQKMEYVCLAAKEHSNDKIYINGLSKLFQNKFWYFSDQYDLTNSLQQFFTSGQSLKNKRMQYMYNSDWIDDFLKIKAYQWITGFISGCISINFTHATANNSCELALITRRDKRRQGKRWIIRGCDLDGNTANTAETEMIFFTESGGKQYLFSHVQLRGSMPFIWKQTPNLGWSPSVTIHPNDKLNADLAKKNYLDIKSSYENCVFINLIDKKGTQKRLGTYFDKMHNAVEDQAMRLIWFDFHDQCKKMKYQNLSKLLDMVGAEIENYGYFHIEMVGNSGERASRKNTQKGIFRTNCMDCLDRTNVVQSVFARQILLSWLTKLSIMSKSRVSSAFERLPDNLEEFFRVHWTKNADVVSILYSGTPAMKTDFTATGKRTLKGAFNDGYYGVKRFFLGNFYDSRDQDMIDFSLGKIKPKRDNQKIRHSLCNSLYFLILLVLIAFLVIGHQVDNFIPDGINFHYKFILGVLSAGLILFSAKQLKSVFLRHPIKAETHL